MSNFHVCKKIKSFFLIALSVIILACSVPQFSFKSEAVSTSTAITYSILSTFFSYMASQGYTYLKGSSGSSNLPTSIQAWQQASDELTEDVFNTIAAGLDSMYPGSGSGAEFLSAVYLATRVGYMRFSKSLYDKLHSYFDNHSTNGSYTGSTVTSPISNYYKSAGFTYQFGGRQWQGQAASISFRAETIAFLTSDGNNLFFLCPDINSYSGNSNNKTVPVLSDNTPQQSYARFAYNGNYYSITVYPARYTDYPVNFVGIDCGYNSINDIANVFAKFYAGDYNNVVSDALTSSVLTDTSNVDVITSTNTVSDTGAIEGDYTYYVLDSDALTELLNQYDTGAITYDQLIKALGLANVATDASVATKEDAASTVVTAPEIYDWLTKTEWGGFAISETADSLSEVDASETTKTTALGELFKRYPGGEDPDQDDLDKAGTVFLISVIAYFLSQWHWPDFTPESADGGGTDDEESDPEDQSRAADVIAGIGVASSLIGNIFDAAGGSSGYGMIFTVGMSFVLFSVIIGASHFLGSLGNHAEVQAKKEDREVVRATHRNNLETSRIRLIKAQSKRGA